MHRTFRHTSASWVRYNDYEWRTAEDGQLYLIPTVKADPRPYDPMRDAEQLVCDAMELASRCFLRQPKTDLMAAMRTFACKYGLLGS